jgi:aspartate aminotransferase
MAALERDLPAGQRRVFTVFSYSKSFAMTGYRLGYVAAPDAARAATLQVVEEASILSSPTPVQYAGLAALDAMDDVAVNRELVRSAKNSLAPLVELGLLDRLPAGGWFALLDVAGLDVGAEEFAEELLERDAIAVAPARGFALRPELDIDGAVRSVDAAPSTMTQLRVAFCGPPVSVHRAAQKIAAYARTLR